MAAPTPEQMVDAMHALHCTNAEQPLGPAGPPRGMGMTCPRMHVPARKCPFRTPIGHIPHLPLTCQSFPHEFTEVGILYIGVQAPSNDLPEVIEWRKQMKSFMDFRGPRSPFQHIRSAYTDPSESYNEFEILYFDAFAKADAWLEQTGFTQFMADYPVDGPTGIWCEVMMIPFDRAETMFTPGAAANPDRFAYGLGKKGLENGYYPTSLCNYSGSARDRIPASGVDDFEQPEALKELPEPIEDETRGQRIKVKIPGQISVIRSGQDWSASEGRSRAQYEKKMSLILKKGMNYLATNQVQTGTICNRFVHNLDEANQAKESTYGLCYSISLAKLEQWADISRDEEGKLKGHSTHNVIYEQFNEAFPAGEMDKIELFHEVYVTPSEGCHAEYINCHNRTGFLGWAGKLW